MNRLLRLSMVAAIFCVACASTPVPVPPIPERPKLTPLPAGAVPIASLPGIYVSWWRDVEQCAGRTANIARVSWYAVVPATEGFKWNGEMVLALAYDDRNAIVIAGPWLLDSMVVRHEILHLIASRRGHNPEYFQRRCRGLVMCFEDCLSDTTSTQDD